MARQFRSQQKLWEALVSIWPIQNLVFLQLAMQRPGITVVTGIQTTVQIRGAGCAETVTQIFKITIIRYLIEIHIRGPAWREHAVVLV